MTASALDKIYRAYNPEHDLGPEAPIHWSVAELAYLVGKLIEKVNAQELQIKALQNATPSGALSEASDENPMYDEYKHRYSIK